MSQISNFVHLRRFVLSLTVSNKKRLQRCQLLANSRAFLSTKQSYCLVKIYFRKNLNIPLNKDTKDFAVSPNMDFYSKTLEDIIFISTSHHLITATIWQIFFKFLIFCNFWDKNLMQNMGNERNICYIAQPIIWQLAYC